MESGFAIPFYEWRVPAAGATFPQHAPAARACFPCLPDHTQENYMSTFNPDAPDANDLRRAELIDKTRRLLHDAQGLPGASVAVEQLKATLAALESNEDEEAVEERELDALRADGILPRPETIISRRTFDTLSPVERAAHVGRGGKVADDPPATKASAPLGANQMRRTDFARLSPLDQMAHVKAGGTVAD
jgi:hypothetical protein